MLTAAWALSRTKLRTAERVLFASADRKASVLLSTACRRSGRPLVTVRNEWKANLRMGLPWLSTCP